MKIISIVSGKGRAGSLLPVWLVAVIEISGRYQDQDNNLFKMPLDMTYAIP